MIAVTLSALVLLIHMWFLYMEMIAWEAPATRRAFGTTPEFAAATRAMAANQGLYNGFLAVGIGLGWTTANAPMLAYLLLCCVVAGVYAAATGIRRALLVQSLPAALALAALWFGV